MLRVSVIFLLLLVVLSASAEEVLSIRLTFPTVGSYSVSIVEYDETGTETMEFNNDTLSRTKSGIIINDNIEARMLFARGHTDMPDFTDTIRHQKYSFETVQEITGRVSAESDQKNIKIMALNCRNGMMYETFADKDGYFSLTVGDYPDNTNFNIDAFIKWDKDKKYHVKFDDENLPRIPKPVNYDFEVIDEDEFKSQYDYVAMDSDAIILKDIEVKGHQIKEKNRYRIDSHRGYYEGDPKIAQYSDILSLLRSIGVYSLNKTTILLDDQVIQRSTDTEDDAFETDIAGYLRTAINISEVWQVEYIKHDPRVTLFQSFQNMHPVLLIYTKYGVNGNRKSGRGFTNLFYPKGYEPNDKVWQPVKSVPNDATLYWNPDVYIQNPDEDFEISIKRPIKSDKIKITILGISFAGAHLLYKNILEI